VKNLAGAPTLPQGFEGYTRGCTSAPPQNSIATRRDERPIGKHQPLSFLTDTTAEARGLLSGTAIRVP
jgi:hypothetical protein